MPDVEQIDPTVDRVWAVDATVTYTSNVIAETREEAERTAENEADDVKPRFSAHELTEPIEPRNSDGRIIPYGRSRWEGRDLTVEEAVELVAAHRPAYDDETLLMPFADAPPPLQPARIEDYLADRGPAR